MTGAAPYEPDRDPPPAASSAPATGAAAVGPGGVDEPGVRLAVAVAAVAGAADAKTALAAAMTGAAGVLAQGWAALVEGGDVLAEAGDVPAGLPAPPGGHRHVVLALGDGLALHAGRPGPFGPADEVYLEAIGVALLLALRRAPAAVAPAGAAPHGQPAVDELMGEVQRAVAEGRPLPAVLDAVTAGASVLFGGALVQLRVPGDGGAPTEVRSSTGPEPEAIAPGTAFGALVEDLCLRVVEGGRVRFAASVDQPDGGAGVSALAAPVHEQGAATGSLLVCTRQPGRRFDERERDVLAGVAGLAGMALANARTVEELQQVFHDPLTRLPNRSLFLDRLEHAREVAGEPGAHLALLFIDLDDFARINERLGRTTGDAVLSVVADRLRGCLRDTDTAARLGGDEFAVLVERIGELGEATRVAGRILDALGTPIAVAGADVTVRASIGIAFGDIAGDASRHLLRDADLAMRRAKEEGKARWLVFAPPERRTVVERTDLDADLRSAVEQREFVVHYQPVVRLANERVVGFEALVRWAHPQRGLLAPAAFVPAGEDSGLIVDIGRQVLRTACATLAAWQAGRQGPPLSMSVNLSVRQLGAQGLAGDVAKVLAETGVAPESLVLEVTETVLMADLRTSSERLRELKRLGVRLAIEDVGIGTSALGYLRDLRFDLLKLDESFLSGLGSDPEAASLVRRILEIGETLKLRTLAEGIESRTQLVQLRAMGCDLGQGFLFSRALSAAEVEQTLGGGGAARRRAAAQARPEGLPVGSSR